MRVKALHLRVDEGKIVALAEIRGGGASEVLKLVCAPVVLLIRATAYAQHCLVTSTRHCLLERTLDTAMVFSQHLIVVSVRQLVQHHRG